MSKSKISITDREREILDLLAADRDLHEIAADLHLSYHTVQFHIKNLKEKLDVRTLHGLVVKMPPKNPRS